MSTGYPIYYGPETLPTVSELRSYIADADHMVVGRDALGEGLYVLLCTAFGWVDGYIESVNDEDGHAHVRSMSGKSIYFLTYQEDTETWNCWGGGPVGGIEKIMLTLEV